MRLAAKGKRCGRKPRAGGAFCCKTGDFVIGRLRSPKFEQILPPPAAAAEILGAPAAATPTTGRFGKPPKNPENDRLERSSVRQTQTFSLGTWHDCTTSIIGVQMYTETFSAMTHYKFCTNQSILLSDEISK